MDIEQTRSRRSPSKPTLQRITSVRRTVRTLQLDHTESLWGTVSYVVGFLLLIFVPICKVLFVQASSSQQLLFQPVVVVIGVSRSLVSFVFLSQAIRQHGLTGFLFLDSAAAEVAEVQKDYEDVIEQGVIMLLKLFIPALVLYAGQLTWLYSNVDLKPLPFHIHGEVLELVLIVITTGVSWIFQTTTYLYACVLFWKVCKLQELKLGLYFDRLDQGLDAEHSVSDFNRILQGLRHTSRRFRHFLAFTGGISISGALIAMYEVVNSFHQRYELYLWGELVVLTIVNLTGAWLCLKSAARIAHLHKRIVRRASYLYAEKTLGTPVGSSTTPTMPSIAECSAEDDSKRAFLEKLEAQCDRQECYARRTALVNYLSTSVAGISVYGFILDRFFVQTSFGAVLATTWFILGRSLTV